MHRIFQSEYLAPAALALLLSLGGTVTTWLIEVRDATRGYYRIQVQLNEMSNHQKEMDRKVEKILGYLEGQEKRDKARE